MSTVSHTDHTQLSDTGSDVLLSESDCNLFAYQSGQSIQAHHPLHLHQKCSSECTEIIALKWYTLPLSNIAWGCDIINKQNTSLRWHMLDFSMHLVCLNPDHVYPHMCKPICTACNSVCVYIYIYCVYIYHSVSSPPISWCVVGVPSHHPGGCCTLVVDEEIAPLLCKALWVSRKALYKCNKLLLLYMYMYSI